MGRFEYKESSSEEKDHSTTRKLEKDDEEKEGGEGPDDEIKFGERLQDDLINTFCDKLQAVCPRKLEALLAIQFLMITGGSEINKHVTGRNSAMQVLYDRKRAHYILVHYNAHRGMVEMYDSLQMFDKEGRIEILPGVLEDIVRLFGHLFREHIPCLIDREYELQQDNFSCGYRVIGALVDLARQRNPATQQYSRTAILKFMKRILAEPRPTWEMFESARIGKTKEYDGRYLMRVWIENHLYTSSTTTSSNSSISETSSLTRTSSEDSLASIGSESSEHSHDDPFRGYDLRKAPTGFSLRPLDPTPPQPRPSSLNRFIRPSESPPSPATALESPSIAPCQSESTIMGYIRNQFHHLMNGITRRRDNGLEVEGVGKGKVKEHED